MTTVIPELLPCPFCGGKETHITENRHPPTMSGRVLEPISVDIFHHCQTEGLPRLRINITGRDKSEAIYKWNTRTDLVAAKLAAAEKIRAAFEKQWPNWEKYPSGNYVDEIIQSYWQRFEEGWKSAIAEWEKVK